MRSKAIGTMVGGGRDGTGGRDLIALRMPRPLASLAAVLACAVCALAVLAPLVSADSSVLAPRSDPLDYKCLGARDLQVREVGTTHATVEFERFDECVFDAWTSVEVQAVGDNWVEARQVQKEKSKRTGGKWVSRAIRIEGLRNKGPYRIRVKIEHAGGDSETTDSVLVRTGGDPARDMKASLSAEGEAGVLYGRKIDVAFTAALPNLGENSVVFRYSGDTSYSRKLALRVKRAPTGEKECHALPGERTRCDWIGRITIYFGQQPKPADGSWIHVGENLHGRVFVANSIYSREFGIQRTKDMLITDAGVKPQVVEVGRDD